MRSRSTSRATGAGAAPRALLPPERRHHRRLLLGRDGRVDEHACAARRAGRRARPARRARSRKERVALLFRDVQEGAGVAPRRRLRPLHLHARLRAAGASRQAGHGALGRADLQARFRPVIVGPEAGPTVREKRGRLARVRATGKASARLRGRRRGTVRPMARAIGRSASSASAPVLAGRAGEGPPEVWGSKTSARTASSAAAGPPPGARTGGDWP